jgi:hypothetical protein
VQNGQSPSAPPTNTGSPTVTPTGTPTNSIGILHLSQ